MIGAEARGPLRPLTELFVTRVQPGQLRVFTPLTPHCGALHALHGAYSLH
jgi:hypothetical protein